jgi:hypothetical protein
VGGRGADGGEAVGQVVAVACGLHVAVASRRAVRGAADHSPHGEQAGHGDGGSAACWLVGAGEVRQGHGALGEHGCGHQPAERRPLAHSCCERLGWRRLLVLYGVRRRGLEDPAERHRRCRHAHDVRARAAAALAGVDGRRLIKRSHDPVQVGGYGAARRTGRHAAARMVGTGRRRPRRPGYVGVGVAGVDGEAQGVRRTPALDHRGVIVSA